MTSAPPAAPSASPVSTALGALSPALVELWLGHANAVGMARAFHDDLTAAERRQAEAKHLLQGASQSLGRVMAAGDLPEGAAVELTWIRTMLDRALLALSERGGR